MIKKAELRKNMYFDSVTLMSLTGKIRAMEGVIDAVVSMATEMNKDLLKGVGLFTEEMEGAGPSDLLLAVSSEKEEVVEEAYKMIHELLSPKKTVQGKGAEVIPESVEEAVDLLPEANVAVLSVPGAYAAREARKALENGLHVMIFSDNMSLEEERELKEMGRDKGLLVMGPDCGTSFISGTGLCFANDVRRGGIGIVGASGTGLQEVMVQIHHLGEGVSHGIGTGGRDLHEKIGGIMMLQGIEALNSDPDTKVLLLVSKPPAKSIADKIFETIKKIEKPVVVCFLDGEPVEGLPEHVHFAKGLYEGAELAVSLLQPEKEKKVLLSGFDPKPYSDLLSEKQTDLRGLYCGGTLCAEGLSILRDALGPVKSNVAKKSEEKLTDGVKTKGHVLLDLGEDEYTNGKPHPMIEPSLRNEHILREAAKEETGVILLDFELGYGSHDEAVEVTLKAIEKAKILAEKDDRHLVFVAYVLGTDFDKQDYHLQKRLLREHGILVFDSNKEAALAAAMIMKKAV